MSDLIKVIDGEDFSIDWENRCIMLDDFENIDCDKYDEQLYDLFENHSFEFDESKHEYWESH